MRTIDADELAARVQDIELTTNDGIAEMMWAAFKKRVVALIASQPTVLENTEGKEEENEVPVL